MTDILLITFAMTLLYIGIANRLLTYIRILVFQGFLLFGITFLALSDINVTNLVFILLETVIFKALAVPIFLNYVIKKNGITRIAEPYLPNFISLIIITLILVITIILSNSIHQVLIPVHLLIQLLHLNKQIHLKK